MATGCDVEQCTKIAVCEDRSRWYRQAVIAGSLSAEVVPPCLEQLGLIAVSPSDPGKRVPVAVDVAFAELTRPIESVIEEKRSQVDSLANMFAPLQSTYEEAKREQRKWLTEISGRSLISSTLEHAVRSCEHELITIQPGGARDPQLLREALDRDLSLLRRGVRQRTLYQHSARFDAPTLHYIEEIARFNGEVRTSDAISERVIICDRQVAFIPGGEAREVSALEIRHPAIVNFLLTTFEGTWEQATPVTSRRDSKHPQVTDETLQAILRLLVAGHTDETIARRLGKSRRSIAGYVSKISAELGSHSRAQLGYLVAKFDLLEFDQQVGSTGADTPGADG